VVSPALDPKTGRIPQPNEWVIKFCQDRGDCEEKEWEGKIPGFDYNSRPLVEENQFALTDTVQEDPLALAQASGKSHQRHSLPTSFLLLSSYPLPFIVVVASFSLLVGGSGGGGGLLRY
jgi:hypothetical protein